MLHNSYDYDAFMIIFIYITGVFDAERSLQVELAWMDTAMSVEPGLIPHCIFFIPVRQKNVHPSILSHAMLREDYPC